MTAADSASLPASAVLREAEGRREWMLVELETQVAIESPTSDAGAIDAMLRHLEERLEERGFVCERIRGGAHGDHLRAHLGPSDGTAVLVLSHVDTVWPVGTVAERPFRIDGERAYGPGTADMKGGIVVGLAAIDALRAAGAVLGHGITWLITCDEEIGSPSSRSLIEEEARSAHRVLVTEPGDPTEGGVKTRRKGTGAYDLEAYGVASHAGAAHEDGASAIAELARQVVALEALTDYATGVTANVGAIGGGTARNVVPANAWAKLDLRVETAEAPAAMDARIQGLASSDPRVRLTVRGGISRPPMARPSCVAQVYELAASLAVELGVALPEVASGGGSDANFTAALGVPTLDGLGAVGAGMHAAYEHVLIPHLAPRAALLALLAAAPADRGPKESA